MVTMNDAQDPYEHDEDILGENMQEGNVETESNGRREHTTFHNLVETMRSFNERLIKVEEKQNQINATILQSLTNIQQRANPGSNPSNVG